MLIIFFLLNLIVSYIFLSYFYRAHWINFYDIPNHRSLHKSKKKKIGGLALLLLILTNLIFLNFFDYQILSLINLSFVFIIFFINLINDRRNIHALIRLIIFSLLYFIILSLNLENNIILKSYILMLTIFFLSISIFTNFNDGSDFYISFVYIFLILGILIYNILFLLKYEIFLFSIIFFSFLIIYYFFNFYPSKIFLGDSGAYLLSLYPFFIFINSNFDLNTILISFHFLSPIIIDSSLTLYLRLKRNKNIFKPHLEHFFQKIAINRGHKFLIKISSFLLIANLIIYLYFILAKLNFLTLPIFSLLSYLLFRMLVKKYGFSF